MSHFIMGQLGNQADAADGSDVVTGYDLYQQLNTLAQK